MTFDNFIQFVVMGLSLGAMYSLISIGYTIIYGILKLINLAHGDFFMLAGFLGMWGALYYGVPLWLSLVFGLALTVGVILFVNWFIYRPLRQHKMAAFTSTFAISMIVQASVIMFLSARAQAFPHPDFLNAPIKIGNIIIPMITPFIIVIALILFGILTLIVNKTKIGRAMRAVSLDMEMVTLMGVNVENVIAFSFALSVVLCRNGRLSLGNALPSFRPEYRSRYRP